MSRGDARANVPAPRPLDAGAFLALADLDPLRIACRKCHRPITQDGRDGHWTDDVHNWFGDICSDGNYHEPEVDA